MKILRLTLTLAIVSGLSGLIIGFVNDITAPDIEVHNLEKEIAAYSEFYPSMTDFEKEEFEDETSINSASKIYEDDTLLGYVYSSTGVNSYGEVTMLVAIDTNDNIIDIMFTEFLQTPGFGDKLLEDSYLNQFDNVPIDGFEIDGVSGATYSSKLIDEEVHKIINYHKGAN